MRRALLLIAALVATVLVATTSATADSTYTDPAGDGRGVGPDVTAVAVTNDGEGVITMRVTAAAVAGSGLVVVFDTDLNGLFDDSTSRLIDLMMPASGVVIPVAYAMDSVTNKFVPTSAPSLRATATATDITLSFAKTELGIDKGFGFWTWGWNSTSDEGDEAPDVGELDLHRHDTASASTSCHRQAGDRQADRDCCDRRQEDDGDVPGRAERHRRADDGRDDDVRSVGGRKGARPQGVVLGRQGPAQLRRPQDGKREAPESEADDLVERPRRLASRDLQGALNGSGGRLGEPPTRSHREEREIGEKELQRPQVGSAGLENSVVPGLRRSGDRHDWP